MLQIWNYLMAGGRLPQQLQHWPGFWALDWMLGPLSPALIRISPSASDPCSGTCFVTLWCNRLHLTGTVDVRHAVYGPRLLHHGMVSYIIIASIYYFMTREYLQPFTSSDEASWRWPTLIAVFYHVPMVRRGRVGSYQLSVFQFQIVAVFGRIRIVHLTHYSVWFQFESNIWYSPNFQ